MAGSFHKDAGLQPAEADEILIQEENERKRGRLPLCITKDRRALALRSVPYGAYGIRTRDLLHAMETRSQLR